MTELHCALCGTNRGKLVAQHFVTVDVVDDPKGEMLGGELKHHTLYLCDECRVMGKTRYTLPGCLVITLYCCIALGICFGVILYMPSIWDWLPVAWIVYVFVPGVVGWLYYRRRQRGKLRKIAAVHHGETGPVRVFKLEQFEKFQAGRKHKDGTKSSSPRRAPKGKTVDLDDSAQPDEFAFVDDEDSSHRHYDGKGAKE